MHTVASVPSRTMSWITPSEVGDAQAGLLDPLDVGEVRWPTGTACPPMVALTAAQVPRRSGIQADSGSVQPSSTAGHRVAVAT